MTERSLTPSAIAFGLSEVALEGCKKKKKNTMLEHGFNTQLYTFPSVFIQKVNFLRMLAVLYLFFYLSLQHSLCEAIFRHTLRLSSELKRGMPKHSSRGTHSSSALRAERNGSEHSVQREAYVYIPLTGFEPSMIPLSQFPTSFPSLPSL